MQAASKSLQDSRAALADAGAAAATETIDGAPGSDALLRNSAEATASEETRVPRRKRQRAGELSRGADNAADQAGTTRTTELAELEEAYKQLQLDCDAAARQHLHAVQRYDKDLRLVDRGKIAADVAARAELAALATTIADAQASAQRLQTKRCARVVARRRRLHGTSCPTAAGCLARRHTLCGGAVPSGRKCRRKQHEHLWSAAERSCRSSDSQRSHCMWPASSSACPGKVLSTAARRRRPRAAALRTATLHTGGFPQRMAGVLCRIFAELTGGAGDAELLLTLDKHLLFAEGIVMSVRCVAIAAACAACLHAVQYRRCISSGGAAVRRARKPDASVRRPGQGAWRCFQELSGGQQALAALALSLAIHAASPSTWFLCDEVDAALDVLRASQLAAYMRRSATQFVVVSHKPQARLAARMPCPCRERITPAA